MCVVNIFKYLKLWPPSRLRDVTVWNTPPHTSCVTSPSEFIVSDKELSHWNHSFREVQHNITKIVQWK